MKYNLANIIIPSETYQTEFHYLFSFWIKKKSYWIIIIIWFNTTTMHE